MAPIQILLMAPRSESTLALADVLTGQADMHVMEAPPSRGVELLSLLGRTEADVLVVESEPAGAVSLSAQVLSEYPHLVVLAISPEDRTITLNRLRMESRRLPTSSMERLPSEVRVAVGS